MWEAKAAPGETDALLEWLVGQAPEAAQIYRSTDRVVLIAELPGADRDSAERNDLQETSDFPPSAGLRPLSWPLADPPEALVARPPHSWEFDRLQ